ncbi:acyl-CoA dehydrogenase family protein [Rhodococcus opacus]|uniref:Putative acyl-CoA dehydrogenase n=1 Tax=Rhodococcus opacus (strain B4) TaxID=632772 RepID=C1B3M8_RHOOB|nr:acyl-CoA dehydrogenase family protein [Rhodococcus opacus]BAH50726.1 putative acyl-CoA dehydrogenase [Rhodococcus opacus B4]
MSDVMVEERDQLRSAVRSVITRHGDVRAWLESTVDTGDDCDLSLWRTLAEEVGVAGLLVAEDLGGAGAQVADAAAVFEETGRALSPVPLFSTVGLASAILLGCGDAPEAGRLLQKIAEGAVVATAAFHETETGWFLPPTSTAATETDGRWHVTGKKGFVVDAAAADIVLVTASTPHGTGLFAVEAGAAGLQRRMLDSLDLVRALGTVEFANTPATLLATGEAASAAVASGLDLAVTLLSAELVGAGQQCLDEAVAYVKQRVQFDRKIGSFQAIKHTLVDVLLELEMARSAADAAVAAAEKWLRNPDPGTATALAIAASVSKSVCADAFMHIAEETLHVFGGIGFTWEHDAHLYYRRAKFGELYLGTASEHRERVAQLSGLGERRV